MHPSARRLDSLLVPAIFAVDRLTKWWAQSWLQPRGSVEVLPFFHLTYLENTGAAFSILTGSNRLLTVISMVLLALIILFRERISEGKPIAEFGLLLVAGGALGNLYDRLAYGYVVDFLDFLVWPVFNAADSFITIGAACLLLGLRDEKGKRRR